MLFSEKITIGNILTIIPHIWRKTEQNGQEIAEVKEIAIRANGKAELANGKADRALEIAENNQMRPMTENEVTELFEGIFGKNKK